MNLKKVYPASAIIGAAAGYFKMTETELVSKKGRWNPGKRLLIYLLSRDGGMNNTGIAALLNGLHNSGIGPIITAVRKEIASGKRAKKDVRKISESYVRNEEVKVVNY